MPSSRAGWCLIFVVAVVVVAGVIGIGSAQETPATAANTTTAAGVTIEETTETSSSSANSTTSAQPRTTPDVNDEWQNATPVNIDQTVNGTLPVGDQDWSVFTFDSSGTITVHLAAANRTNLSGFLYNSEGDLLDSSYVAPSGQISLSGETTTGGDYYVFVRNEANDTGTYTFEVSVGEAEGPVSEQTPLQPETNGSGGSGGSSFNFALDLLAGIVVVVAGGYLLFRGLNDSSQVEDE